MATAAFIKAAALRKTESDCVSVSLTTKSTTRVSTYVARKRLMATGAPAHNEKRASMHRGVSDLNT